jgi:spore coat protein U-like protein
MKRRGIAVLLAVGMLAGAEVHTESTTFRVSARVQEDCVATAPDLDVGSLAALRGSLVRGATVLQATCMPNTTYSVGLNAGTSPGATVNQRRMVSGSQVVNYQLYSDSPRSRIWGETIGTNTVVGVGTGVAQDHTVFGSVPAAQAIPDGEYSDTITVRLYF